MVTQIKEIQANVSLWIQSFGRPDSFLIYKYVENNCLTLIEANEPKKKKNYSNIYTMNLSHLKGLKVSDKKILIHDI